MQTNQIQFWTLTLLRKMVSRFITAFITSLLITNTTAFAQSYPDRPITLVCPFAPGGSADIIARLIAQRLSEELKVPVLVENRAGAGSAIGSNYVSKAKPDGYTILLLSGAYSAQAALTKTPLFDPLKDITMVSLITTYPFLMAVHPNAPYQNLQELIAYAKAKPGQLNYSSSGIGAIHHLSSELLNVMAGIETVHIPTKGGNVAILELMGERIDFLLEAPQLMMPYIKSNKLRGIATTAKTRSKIYNDLPTIAEALPGYEVSSYIGIAVTGGTPEPIIQALYQGVKKSIENKDVAKRLVDLGGEPTHTTPAETKLFVENELDKWRKVINLRKIERQ